MRLKIFAMTFAALCFMQPCTARASDKAFEVWLKKLWPEAKRAGVSSTTFKNATNGLTPDPEVLEKAESQLEFKAKPGEYIARLVSEKRIENGKKALEEHAAVLDAIERKYGVSKYILTAIWGIESNYGASPGTRNVIRSLATLGYTGRRRAFGRQQLIAALRILERGDISLDNMSGSWAGAMGHTQFIPTTYNAYAVDFTGDGKRDIWGSPADALASSAAYLKRSGWRSGATWGYEVELPESLRGLPKGVKTIAQWEKSGIRRIQGAFPRPSDRAWLYAPEGRKGPVFLLITNFRVIKRYNNADTYALAVGHLADRLLGEDPFSKPWPSAAAAASTQIP